MSLYTRHVPMVYNNNYVCSTSSTFLLPSQIGVLAWKLTILTPEYPEGREIIILANDITHMIGSFGPLEDQLFKVRV